MTPRPPTAPKPPASAIRAMRSDAKLPARSENPFLELYVRNLSRIGIWKIFAIHFSIVIILGLAGWLQRFWISDPNPEIIIKLIGTYCFLISTIVIPLVSPDLFPPMIGNDDSFQSVPYDLLGESDARMLIVMRLSAVAAIPLLLLFIIFNPLISKTVSVFDVMPYLQTIITALWVNFLMDLVCVNNGNLHGRPARRLAIVAGFILLHIGMVGLMAREAEFFLRRINLLKILIDINPFSQLYILMEGSDMQWLLVTIDNQRLIDFRLYLFFLHGLVFLGLWLFWRNYMKIRQGSR
ncbi:MAG: hypothetical protein NTY09_02620 [bacterium]|nr:hypothetical protein [bacterium]